MALDKIDQGSKNFYHSSKSSRPANCSLFTSCHLYHLQDLQVQTSAEVLMLPPLPILNCLFLPGYPHVGPYHQSFNHRNKHECSRKKIPLLFLPHISISIRALQFFQIIKWFCCYCCCCGGYVYELNPVIYLYFQKCFIWRTTFPAYMHVYPIHTWCLQC